MDGGFWNVFFRRLCRWDGGFFNFFRRLCRWGGGLNGFWNFFFRRLCGWGGGLNGFWNFFFRLCRWAGGLNGFWNFFLRSLCRWGGVGFFRRLCRWGGVGHYGFHDGFFRLFRNLFRTDLLGDVHRRRLRLHGPLKPFPILFLRPDHALLLALVRQPRGRRHRFVQARFHGHAVRLGDASVDEPRLHQKIRRVGMHGHAVVQVPEQHFQKPQVVVQPEPHPFPFVVQGGARRVADRLVHAGREVQGQAVGEHEDARDHPLQMVDAHASVVPKHPVRPSIDAQFVDLDERIDGIALRQVGGVDLVHQTRATAHHVLVKCQQLFHALEYLHEQTAFRPGQTVRAQKVLVGGLAAAFDADHVLGIARVQQVRPRSGLRARIRVHGGLHGVLNACFDGNGRFFLFFFFGFALGRGLVLVAPRVDARKEFAAFRRGQGFENGVHDGQQPFGGRDGDVLSFGHVAKTHLMLQ